MYAEVSKIGCFTGLVNGIGIGCCLEVGLKAFHTRDAGRGSHCAGDQSQAVSQLLISLS